MNRNFNLRIHSAFHTLRLFGLAAIMAVWSSPVIFAQAAPKESTPPPPNFKTETWEKTLQRIGEKTNSANQSGVTPPGVVTSGEAAKSSADTLAEGKTLFSFRADNVELKTALALFARANNLNIVPDQDVTGEITVDIHDLPLAKMMEALLEAHDFSWTEQNGLIRVRAAETRTYIVDYLRLIRRGIGTSAATLSSASGSSGGSSGGGGGGGFGGGGGGGGLGGGGGGLGGGGGGSGVGASGSVGGSSMNLMQENPVDFWKELKEELGKILTQRGRDSLAVNMTAGLIQVSDRPSALKRVEAYLAQMNLTIARQVDIEAKLYDVTLSDQFQFGIDWAKIVEAGGQFSAGGFPSIVNPVGGNPLKMASLVLSYSNRTTSAVLQALREQGDVTVISQPRLRTMNNQTALIKVGTDRPFFNQSTTFLAGSINTTAIQQAGFQTITIGTILSVTPQISSNGWIILDVSPVITSLVDVESTGTATNLTTAPVLDIKQTSTIVRMSDGDTIVLGGLIQNSTSKSNRKIPLLGDIPGLGRLFQGKAEVKQKKELVIFLTPHIVK